MVHKQIESHWRQLSFDVRKKGINADIDENVNFVFERRQITFLDWGPHFKIPKYLQTCSLESLTTLSTLFFTLLKFIFIDGIPCKGMNELSGSISGSGEVPLECIVMLQNRFQTHSQASTLGVTLGEWVWDQFLSVTMHSKGILPLMLMLPLDA